MAALLVCLTAPFSTALAQGDDLGWSDDAELSLVSTTGNSKGTSFGFKNTLWRRWEKALLEIEAAAIKVRTKTQDNFETLFPGGPLRLGTTQTTAETYYLNGRYNRKIREDLFWYAGAGWYRNVPAGLEDRYLAEGGVGNVWFDREDLKFRSDYGLTYMDQENTIPDPSIDDTFLGARGTWKYWNQLTETTEYTNDFIVDFNFDETEDWRLDMINAIAVAMSKRLSLKVSYRVYYDNFPAKLPLLTGAGIDPVGGEVDELDTVLTASLVVNFK